MNSESVFLLNESPRICQMTLACEIGVGPAMVLQQLHWLQLKFGKEIEGDYWLPQRLADLNAWLPCYPSATLRRYLSKLKTQGLLRCRYDLNAKPWDRTPWYSVDLERVRAQFEPAVEHGVDGQHDILSTPPLAHEPQEAQTEASGQHDILSTPPERAPRADTPPTAVEPEASGQHDILSTPPLDAQTEAGGQHDNLSRSNMTNCTPFLKKYLREKEEDKNKTCARENLDQHKKAEDPQPDYTQLGDLARFCLVHDPMTPCPHVKAIQEALKDRAVLGQSVSNHRHLHRAVHLLGVDEIVEVYKIWKQMGKGFEDVKPHLVFAPSVMETNIGSAKAWVEEMKHPSGSRSGWQAEIYGQPSYYKPFDPADFTELKPADFVPGCPDHSRLLYGIWDEAQMSYTGCQQCQWKPEDTRNPWEDDDNAR